MTVLPNNLIYRLVLDTIVSNNIIKMIIFNLILYFSSIHIDNAEDDIWLIFWHFEAESRNLFEIYTFWNFYEIPICVIAFSLTIFKRSFVFKIDIEFWFWQFKILSVKLPLELHLLLPFIKFLQFEPWLRMVNPSVLKHQPVFDLEFLKHLVRVDSSSRSCVQISLFNEAKVIQICNQNDVFMLRIN